MCYLCEKYGDPNVGSGLWYLNPKNYARSMYTLRPPGEGHKGAEAGPETGTHEGSWADLPNAVEKGWDEYQRVRQQREEISRRRGMASQVVPLKDAEKILELCSGIAMIMCLCREAMRAIDERNEFEYSCMGMGPGMLKWERWPERYKGGVKFLSVEEAKEWTRKMDKRGFVHRIMIMGAPFIGGFCQCFYPICRSGRTSLDFGGGPLKSHYIAQVNLDICNGCGVCPQRCWAGAITMELTNRKANIDHFKCWGCGLCETGCPRGAIKLVERKSLPALANLWYSEPTNLRLGVKFPKITIDHTKCTVPFLCKKCLQACTTAVFHVERVLEREERLKEMDPRIDGNYKLAAPFRNKCTMCNKCVEICPAGAIKIEAP